MKKYIIVVLSLLAINLWSQQKDVELMRINGKPVSLEEFEAMYNKNLDLVQDPSQKDIDKYMQLFTKYKLELEDAYQKKYDTAPQLQKELKTYRRDLAKRYLSDNDVIDNLVEEAYERMQSDVKVAHILIMVTPEATPQDTLKAYNKIMSVYNKAVNGEDFGKLAQQYSDDPSAKQNKGDLDYINVFHTVYPFETAAYNTPVGQVSKPFRTRFGYHIVKVLDKRPAKGEIEVAHILTLNKKNGKEKGEADAKTRIFEIYEKLKNKEDSFENLARKFSDDKNSAKRGGKLRKFSIRAMIPEFEKAAFSLKNEGDFSAPFQTKYGWHIIKLLKKHPIPSFKQAEPRLKQKVMRDTRSKMGKEKLMRKIEKQFPIKMTGNLEPVYKHITKDFFENKWQVPQDETTNQIFFTINDDKQITYKDFYTYLYARQSQNKPAYDRKKDKINRLFEQFKKDKLYEYYNDNLEKIYPEFARTMKEYKNGLMLFQIKSDMIWDKSVKDSLGLQKFYEQNKAKYKLPKRYDVLMVQANDKKTAKKIVKDLKKGKTQKDIKEKYRSNKIIIKQKEYPADDPLFNKHNITAKKPVVYKEGNQYIVLYLIAIKPAEIPGLDDVKGKVTNDYQNFLEEQWVEDLKQKYPVKINEKVWQQLRKKYQK